MKTILCALLFAIMYVGDPVSPVPPTRFPTYPPPPTPCAPCLPSPVR